MTDSQLEAMSITELRQLRAQYSPGSVYYEQIMPFSMPRSTGRKSGVRGSSQRPEAPLLFSAFFFPTSI